MTNKSSSFSPIASGVWRFRSGLSGPHQPVNGYLVKFMEGWFLVDPPADLARQAVLAVTGRNEPSRILITHWQREHVEGILNFPDIPVWVSPGDAWLAGGFQEYQKSIQPWSPPWDWETRGNYRGHLAGAANERPLGRPRKVSGLLREGPLAPGIEVLPTPGHGKSALTLLVSTDVGVLAFCGDLIFGEGQLWNWFDCDWDYGLETGQRALLASVRRLAERNPALLLPAHGEPVTEARVALETLSTRLEKALSDSDEPPGAALNFLDRPSPAKGFRELSPRIFQYRNGNTIIISSPNGRGIVIDDGLCLWTPLPERHARHDAIFSEAKEALGIRKMDWLIPTHYHGDHVDGMGRLARAEGAQVIALEAICGPLERPRDFNLACPLWWYGTGEESLTVDVKVPEGFCLSWEGMELEFFRLGGQTWYHQGIQARQDGRTILFVGDAWWGTSVAPAPVLCWNEAEPESQGWVFALDRMIKRAPDLLVCGHGSALRNPLPILRQTRKEWTARMERFRALNARESQNLFFNPFADAMCGGQAVSPPHSVRDGAMPE